MPEKTTSDTVAAKAAERTEKKRMDPSKRIRTSIKTAGSNTRDHYNRKTNLWPNPTKREKEILCRIIAMLTGAAAT
ncbi:hypothetical protein GCM10010924_51570 [Rhizobium wenxiniae]|nr:hypothetical protein GCM10010924_51570 [Rhizobium wenxiniae]